MNTGQPGGLLHSLRGLVTHGLDLLRNRLELLATELEEEKARLLRLLLLGATAFVMLAAGLVFLAIFLTVMFWDEHRLLVLGLMTAGFLGFGMIALLFAVRTARAGSRLFSASLAELAADQSALDALDEQA